MRKHISAIRVWIIILIVVITFSLAFFIYQLKLGEEGAINDEITTLERIDLAGEWFLNNQDETFIYYQYNYLKKEHPDDHHALREMATLWSIGRLSNFTGDKRYRTLANKGLSYFEKYFAYDKKNNFYYVKISPSKIKLGHSAFIILALIESDHPQKDKYLEMFGNSILFQQEETGELKTFFYSDRNTGIDYYPGEALLALMSLYEYTGDVRYLNAVERAFPFYVKYFEGNPNTAFVPWHSRTYHKLYHATQDKKVAEFVLQMNDFLVKEGHPRNNCSDFNFQRGITIAVYLEGVIKAYDLARELGNKERAACYHNYIQEASKHIAPLQVIESDDPYAVGGYLGSMKSQTMRVDRNQHAVMALMDAFELGILE